MKLLHCHNCDGIVSLTVLEKRYCPCGKCFGKYRSDFATVDVSGPCSVLGIANSSFKQAYEDHENEPYRNLGWRFEAFIIPENAPTVKRRD